MTKVSIPKNQGLIERFAGGESLAQFKAWNCQTAVSHWAKQPPYSI